MESTVDCLNNKNNYYYYINNDNDSILLSSSSSSNVKSSSSQNLNYYKNKLIISSRLLIKLLMILIILNIKLINTFNLDTNIPVYKYGPENSYFGYSVAEHVIKRSGSDVPILLVGAPRAKPRFIRTGALYGCKFTTENRDCSEIEVDPDNSTFSENVDKEDQWLGVTVKSQGIAGYVMVCAHRYVHKGEDFRWGNGICYSLTQSLTYSRTYEPCRGRLVNLAHEQFGFCQAGTSGEISKNYEILIGSPGPYTWRGTVFANNIRPGYSLKDDKTWYMGPVIETKSPVSKYSYLGMSVASGDFLGEKLVIASGAPRSNGTGEVIFYSKDSGKIEFDLKGILHGEQFASSFGYSMASLDCDGDKHSDLAVSAPFFYNRTEGGAVYIYLQKDLKKGIFDNPTRLTGKLESRFGFSLANVGDLNKDKFEDLAVGAPYENSGVVYIYLGSPDGIKKEPAQVIEAMKLPYPLNELHTFGYSLSGGIDMDLNSYPDLLVGAYESDAVVLLRSRPIVKIKTFVKGNMTQIDQNSVVCREDPTSKTACFSVQPCFQFLDAINSTSSLSKFQLNYKIEAETFTGKKYYRVTFNDSQQAPNIVERTIALDGYSREYCQKEVIYLKEKQDIQESIAFKLTYSLKQNIPSLPRPGDRLPDINQYPILDQEEAQRIFYAKFNKQCGPDDICDTDLVLKANLLKAEKEFKDNYTLTLDQDNILLNISVINRAEPAYDTKVFIEHSPKLNYVGRKIQDEQVDCTPNKNKVICSIGNPFLKGQTDFQIRFNAFNMPDVARDFFVHVRTETSSNDISREDNFADFNVELKRKAELELKGVFAEGSVRFGGIIKGENIMKFVDEIGDAVTHRYIVTNHGPLRVKDVAVVVDWPYQLKTNRGIGKWVLYLVARPTVTSPYNDGYCDLDPQYINPIHLQDVRHSLNSYTDDEDVIRRKRSLEFPNIIEKRDEKGKLHKIVKLTCKSGVDCIKIKCLIPNLEANKTAVVHIRSRIWNATFFEDFNHFSQVEISSFGRIMIDPIYNIIQNEQNDVFQIWTQAIPQKIGKAPTASWWWYIVASFIGIILFSVLICMLWKCGFFKRDKAEYEQVDSNDHTDINGDYIN